MVPSGTEGLSFFVQNSLTHPVWYLCLSVSIVVGTAVFRIKPGFNGVSILPQCPLDDERKRGFNPVPVRPRR